MHIDRETVPIWAARWGIAPSGYVSDPEAFDFDFAWHQYRAPDAVPQIILAIDFMSTMLRLPILGGLTSVAVAQIVTVDRDFHVSSGAVLIAGRLIDIPIERIPQLPKSGRLAVNIPPMTIDEDYLKALWP